MNSKFVVLMEWVDNFEDLTWSQKGKLFQAFIDFNKNGEVSINDKMVKMAWKFIEPNVVRMNQKYQKDVENGKKGGRPRKPPVTQIKPPNNPLVTPNNPKETYKDKYNHKHKEKHKQNEKHKVDTGTDISSDTGVIDNFHEKFVEPNECIQNLLDKKLT